MNRKGRPRVLQSFNLSPAPPIGSLETPTPTSLEAEFATIKKEYLALREAKTASDYRADGEHSLHKGKWE